MSTLSRHCDSLSRHPWFQRLVIGLIVFSAVLLGLETSDRMMDRLGRVFHVADVVVVGLFVVEIVIRLLAFLPRPWRFLRDGWNVFDFMIVAASLLPAAGPFAMVARLVRLLRVARLVSVSPQLRLIVATMLRSMSAMGHIVVLLGLLMYIYGVMGCFLFGEVPGATEHWGTLGQSMLSLFTILTLEGWADMQAEILPHQPWAWVYFTSFIVIAVFVVINLFIAVIVNNLQDIRAEAAADPGRHGSAERLAAVIAELTRLREELAADPSAARRPAAEAVSAGAAGRTA